MDFRKTTKQVALGSLALFTSLIGFYGLGYHSFLIKGVHAQVWLALAFSPIWLASIILEFHVVTQSLIFKTLLTMALSMSLSGLLADPVEVPMLVGAYLMVSLAGSLALIGREDRSLRLLLKAGLIGGLSCLALSLAGYLISQFSSNFQSWGFFFYKGPHPIFHEFPRLSGFFGGYPESFGEFSVFLCVLAILSPFTSSLLRTALIILVFSSLLLSGSFAWTGGMFVALGAWLLHRRPSKKVTLLSGSVVLLLISFMFFFSLFGRPIDLPPGEVDVPCDSADTHHHVTSGLLLVEDNETQMKDCRQTIMAWPYPHRLTPYEDSKVAAWEAFRQAPIVGLGREGLGRFSDERAQNRFGNRWVIAYRDGHCLPLGILAMQGIIGFGVFLALTFVLVASLIFAYRKGKLDLNALALIGVLAFFVIGMNYTLLYSRLLWILFGLSAAWELRIKLRN